MTTDDVRLVLRGMNFIKSEDVANGIVVYESCPAINWGGEKYSSIPNFQIKVLFYYNGIKMYWQYKKRKRICKCYNHKQLRDYENFNEIMEDFVKYSQTIVAKDGNIKNLPICCPDMANLGGLSSNCPQESQKPIRE